MRSRMGSDLSALLGNPVPGSFNSRSRMGSDCQHFLIAQRLAVSIRAPAWGATSLHTRVQAFCPFQFALPHGERLLLAQILKAATMFQFALPHGERLLPTSNVLICLGFNSRSRMGSDASAFGRCRRPAVSIRAPAWGATQRCAVAAGKGRVSIRAPA